LVESDHIVVILKIEETMLNKTNMYIRKKVIKLIKYITNVLKCIIFLFLCYIS